MTIELPVARGNGSVVWSPALRSSARPEGADFFGHLGLCELSITAMEHLWRSGRMDEESLHVVNIRSPVHLHAVHPVSKAEEEEASRVQQQRDETFAAFQAVFPEKLPTINPSAPTAPGAIVHKIELKPGALPYSRPLRRMSTQELDELKKQLQEYLESGRLRPSESPWGTNVIFAKKKDGSLRFCVDYRGLNDLTVRNSYRCPIWTSCSTDSRPPNGSARLIFAPASTRFHWLKTIAPRRPSVRDTATSSGPCSPWG
jgi:hypothetical protein